MKLLHERKFEGFPCDYLYARIRCRRAKLDLTGHSSRDRSSDPHTVLRSEFIWIFNQMNRPIRFLLSPVFEYFELRTLVIALRYRAAGDLTAMDRQLQQSLLHSQILKLLGQGEPVAVMIAGLERLLTEEYLYFKGLSEIYLQQGPGGVEQTLIGGCLQRGIACSRSEQVKNFLIYLLDTRNLLALYKHLYWQVPIAPPLLNGGTLEHKDYGKIWVKRDLPGLLLLMGKRAGLSGNPEAEGIEEFMLRGLTIDLRRRGRDSLQLGLLLDYLWRCQLTARNRGLHLSDMELSARHSSSEVSG